MARREQREVESRLAILMAHLLKWQHQPKRRSRSWKATIELQRQELAQLLESGTLHNHAEAALTRAYENGVRLASAEAGLPVSRFPVDCPYTLSLLLDPDLLEE